MAAQASEEWGFILFALLQLVARHDSGVTIDSDQLPVTKALWARTVPSTPARSPVIREPFTYRPLEPSLAAGAGATQSASRHRSHGIAAIVLPLRLECARAMAENTAPGPPLHLAG